MCVCVCVQLLLSPINNLAGLLLLDLSVTYSFFLDSLLFIYFFVLRLCEGAGLALTIAFFLLPIQSVLWLKAKLASCPTNNE